MLQWMVTKHIGEPMGGGTMHVGPPVPQPRSSPVMISSSPSSSSSSPNLKLPVSTDNNVPFRYSSSACCCCNDENCRKLEVVDRKEEERSSGCRYNRVFDAVPSQLEVQDAVVALQNFMQAVSSSGALQQISGSSDSRILLSHGYNRLYDAFLLLQTDPSMKRLVVSLSSDKAVWHAVMNVLHRKLHVLPDSVECRKPQISDEPEISIHILGWILEIIKGKVVELIENFLLLMNDLFQSPKIEKATLDDTELEEKVRSSLLLSIVILLIVILARAQRF